MGFRQEYPDYQSYGNNDYFYNKIPDNFCSALEGYIVRYCKTAQQLKNVINDIVSRIPMELTQNWGWNFLINDLSYYTRVLLREGYREGGKVKHRTLANLSHCSDEEIEAIRIALKGKKQILYGLLTDEQGDTCCHEKETE